MIRFYCILFLVFSLYSCCNMRDVGIYTAVVPPHHPLDNFEFKIIFSDSHLTKVNGLKNVTCKQVFFEESDSYSGQDHIHIIWDNSSCKYVGIGFAWGNYKSKDLSEIIESSAIEMMIRVDEGEHTKLPMFFSIWDYGGKQCFSKINYLDIEGGYIGQNWTKVRIPLQSFNYKKRGVNISNIKELRVEFQQSGSVHIDDMKIVPHAHNYNKSDTEFKTTYTSFPIHIGVDSKYWWGVNSKYSSNFEFSPKTVSGKSESLIANVDLSNNDSWNNFGFAFDKWNYVDISQIYSTSALNFKIRSSSIPNLQIMLVTYKGERRRIQKLIDESNFKEIERGVFEILLPIKSFTNYDLIDWSSLKEIRITVQESSQFEIGEFQIVEFRGNPAYPKKWIGK